MNILFFGDSITWGAWDKEGGWVARIKKYIDQKVIDSDFEYYHDVYNLGVSGNNTPDLLERFDSETQRRIDTDNGTVLVFAIGVNDSQFVKDEGHRVSPDQFEKNIVDLVGKARKYTENIVFIGLFPTDDSKTVPTIWDSNKSYKLEYVSKYNRIIEKVAKKEKVHFVDLYDQLINKNYKELLIDGLHPNTEGHKMIFEIVLEYLESNKIL